VRPSRSGLTLIEVLIAIIVLGVGIVALAGSSAMVTRMIGRGKAETHAAEAAARRIEILRHTAYSTSPRCTAPGFASGGPVLTNGVTESWSVPASGKIRKVRVTVSYLTIRGSRSAVLETGIEC
jgi:prepilin-type N-terminal cleavage/methylation domain-containing protein